MYKYIKYIISRMLKSDRNQLLGSNFRPKVTFRDSINKKLHVNGTLKRLFF